MIYVGSKKRIITQIGPIIARNCSGVIVEPFCGGLNATEWFVKQGLRVEASDNNRYLIALYDRVRNGGELPFVRKSDFTHVKTHPERFPDWYIAFTRLLCTFGSDWNGGYADITIQNDGRRLDFVQLRRKVLLTEMRGLLNMVRPFEMDYRDILPKRKTLYLDPPYKGCVKYASEFNHNEFYAHCEKLKSRDNQVFISEYEMPSEFTEVWSRELGCNLSRKETGQTRIERLYTI